jgi:hypothetical protein
MVLSISMCSYSTLIRFLRTEVAGPTKLHRVTRHLSYGETNIVKSQLQDFGFNRSQVLGDASAFELMAYAGARMTSRIAEATHSHIKC